MTDLQTRTLLTYTALTALPQPWPGALILTLGLDLAGAALALAANIAGATCLAIDPDPAACRAAMRTGAVDFVVNTVDESLRVLKNEIRQKKPLSVALELGLKPAIAELLERGVLPALFLTSEPTDQLHDASQTFARQGCLTQLPDPIALTVVHTFSDAAALKEFDRQQQALPLNGPRSAWAFAAPRLFHRDRPYCRVVLAATPREDV